VLNIDRRGFECSPDCLDLVSGCKRPRRVVGAKSYTAALEAQLKAFFKPRVLV
jgi:hypothetical protein